MRALILAGILSFAAATGAAIRAQDEDAAAREPAVLRGLDPVELCRGRQTPGLEEHELRHHVHRYLFASAENQAEFQREPARYEMQFGGACASMGPLSELGNPNLFVIWNGRIYVFASDSCRQTFLDDPPAHIDFLDDVPASTPETAARGAELVALAVEAIGGAERLDELESLVMRLDPIADAEGRELLYGRGWTIAFPERMRAERLERGLRTVHAAAGEGGFAEWAGRTEPLHPAQRAALEREARRLVLTILKSRGRPDFRAVARGAAEIRGTPVERVAVAFADLTSVLSIDPTSGRVLRQQHLGRAGGGPNGMLILDYSDFREVDGLVLPFAQTALWNGLPAHHLSFTWSDLRVDVELAPELFELPAAPR